MKGDDKRIYINSETDHPLLIIYIYIYIPY